MKTRQIALKIRAVSVLYIFTVILFIPQIKAQTDTLNAAALEQSFVAIAEKYKTSVVSISTKKIVKQAWMEDKFFFGDSSEIFSKNNSKKYFERKYEGGSGIIITSNGYVLTNYHVIKNAEDIIVHIGGQNQTNYEAKITGQDPFTDLAVIKIISNEKFTAAALGDSNQVKVGDWVLAIGAPYSLEQTVTAGIISAQKQNLEIEGKTYTNLIQTDAAINKGNSGGPLINTKGEVIGINTAVYTPTCVFSGVGFAIPVNNAKEIINDLIEKGRVLRGWLGLETQDIDQSILKYLGVKEKSGILVNAIAIDSPAYKAGFERGDILIDFNGEKVKNCAQLQRLVKTFGINKKASISIIRNKNIQNLNVQVEEMPSDLSQIRKKEDKKASKAEWEGIEVENMIGAAEGVQVVYINFQRAVLDIKRGDIIKSINKQAVKNIDDFKKVINSIDLSEGIIFDIIRDDVSMYSIYSGK